MCARLKHVLGGLDGAGQKRYFDGRLAWLTVIKKKGNDSRYVKFHNNIIISNNVKT